jgi:hypothetical protein|uniref:Uncharacterized protein n=1 Tax=viral metagenome TaxID=1070528 RepID=A0A6C0BJH6_9ZZZZ
MVNTFLVHLNYTESAKLLDHKRLPNQRREAFQILCHIQRLKAIGTYLQQPLPSDPYLWYDWIRKIIREYRKISADQDGRLVRINQQWQFISNKDPSILPETVELEIVYGYIYHPAVLMWLGYEESLKEYLTAHITISIARGVKNNMQCYETHNATRPPWTLDPSFITRHRTILLQKEIDRHETPWYQHIPDFIDPLTPKRYFWPFTPSLGPTARNQGESDPNGKYRVRIKITIKLK